METLILHIPRLYEKRYLLLEGTTPTDHIREEGENGSFIAAETFMSPDSQALIANYQSNELTMFKFGKSTLISRLIEKGIEFEPLEIIFRMERPNKKKHQFRRP